MDSNITHKDKALELFSTYIVATMGMPTLTHEQAKRCAVLACEEVIKQSLNDEELDAYEFWQLVKEKIELI